MFTFAISYDETIDGFGIIQFCAQTKDEAITLFKEWCKTDLKNENIDITKIEVIYNENDANEYGDEYMTPEHYVE